MDASVDTRQLEPLAYIDADGRKHNFDAPPSSGDPLGQGWCLGRFYKSYVDYLLSIKNVRVLEQVWKTNVWILPILRTINVSGMETANEITIVYVHRRLELIQRAERPLAKLMNFLRTRSLLLFGR